MSFTRDQLVTEARALADAESDTRWTSTTVLRHLDTVFDSEWGRVLAAFPSFRVSHLTPAVDTDGYLQKADLTGGTGDSLRRFYRIVGVRDGSRTYALSDLGDNVLTAELGGGLEHYGPVYWWEGDAIRLSPVPTGTVTVTVTHRPQLPTALASGSSTVTFPEPWEMLLAYGTAALMLTKGGGETGAAADLKATADLLRDDMLADLSRRDQVPATWRYSDSRADWAG